MKAASRGSSERWRDQRHAAPSTSSTGERLGEKAKTTAKPGQANPSGSRTATQVDGTHAAFPRLYSVADAARLLGCSEKSIRRIIKRGDIPIHRIGRQIKIAEPDLLDYLARNRTR
jgi:excisionase family DNA binding protein